MVWYLQPLDSLSACQPNHYQRTSTFDDFNIWRERSIISFLFFKILVEILFHNLFWETLFCQFVLFRVLKNDKLVGLGQGEVIDKHKELIHVCLSFFHYQPECFVFLFPMTGFLFSSGWKLQLELLIYYHNNGLELLKSNRRC